MGQFFIRFCNGIDSKYLHICADGRYPNEIKAAQKRNYFLIRIIRPNSIYANQNLIQDSSETALDDFPDSEFNAIIINDGSKEDLEQKVSELFNKYINPQISQ